MIALSMYRNEGAEILTSIKGHKSVTNLRKMIHNNPSLDFVNINTDLYINLSNTTHWLRRNYAETNFWH